MTWHRYARAGALLSAPIFVGSPAPREGAGTATSAHVARAATASTAGGEVSGTLAVLGSDALASDAVVYLEPISEPVEAPRAPVALPVAAPLATSVAPRDSVRLLWGAVRELGALTRELRQRLTDLRAGTPARTDVGPATPTLAAIDSAATFGTAGGPRREAPRPVAIRAVDPMEAAFRPATDARAEIAMRQKTFLPHVRVVAAGGTVAWPNMDPFSHNVFSNTPGGSFDLGLYPRGERRGAAFRRAGVYAVFCNIHPHMSAYVVAVPGGYYARPQANGQFVIADVPPGRYRLHAWHERARESFARVITVADRGAAPVSLTLDTRGFRPQPHANKFGQPYARSTTDEY